MSEAIVDALQAIQSDLEQVEMLSQNIANQSTPGYKAIETAAQPFDLSAPQAARSNQPVSTVGLLEGNLRQTNNDLDIAVTNGGFLEVDGARGDRVALVRGGTVAFDENGRATINGRILTSMPDNSTTTPPGFNFSAQPADANARSTNFFHAVSVTDTSSLKLVAPGVYEIDSKFVTTASNRTSVLQGYLEQSNVNSSQVVVQMMELSKHIESVQRSLRAIDEMLGSGINELGR